ncbi:flavin-containing monooxygenase 5-like [Parasteatoda tepidariorum]|uniref:flavin-containing monooxygenase 5-like n=1 Tax=Parasteatoda tepidariorum TaxID=114398 RepID=UPI00077FBED0|nr:flavin-containing monooxygenase 5-like [Parasteatoda tepidariorum]
MRVAVIGAGPCGITAIKACIEESIDVVCFEKTGNIGGLWRYHDDDELGKPSVMKSTVVNSHKELSAYTDFPPPADFPNYMHHTEMLKYLEMYADHFRIRPFIRFHNQVVSVFRARDYQETGRWTVIVRKVDEMSEKFAEEVEEDYDGVMVCTGHHALRNFPQFPGQKLFGGKIVHAHSLKTCDAFKDLRVVVVGAANSGSDVAVEMSERAKQVFLSTRRGTWVVARRGPLGYPFDPSLTCRLFYFILSLVGYDLCSSILEKTIVNVAFDHKLYGLQPKHRFLRQHPTTNDYMPSKIMSGRIIIRPNIKRFTENGVVFDNEESATPVDVVVFATGYHISFPFIKEDFADFKDNKVDLYKYMFPLSLQHPSLAFIGLCQPNGAVFPIADSQCQWFAMLLKGKVKLPPVETMIENTCLEKKTREERYVESPRHTIEVDYLTYIDSIASEYGAKPNLLKMMFFDPVLFLICILGPSLPYQYRLEGPHPWRGARDAIMKYPLRITKPFSGSQTNPSFTHFQSFQVALPTLLFWLSVTINVCLVIMFLFL